jgi:hypothetical protein
MIVILRVLKLFTYLETRDMAKINPQEWTLTTGRRESVYLIDWRTASFEGVVPSPEGTFGEARFDDAIVTYVEWHDGTILTEAEMDEVQERFGDHVRERAAHAYVPSDHESMLEWADEHWTEQFGNPLM